MLEIFNGLNISSIVSKTYWVKDQHINSYQEQSIK